MDRRGFLYLSTSAVLTLVGCRDKKYQAPEKKYEFVLNSDMHTGHLLMGSSSYPLVGAIETEILVVGAGLAGLSAAYEFRGRDLIVCELSDRLGGTAATEQYGGQSFCQGAHYDISYPPYFGEEVLTLLESLQIIKFNPISSMWEFTEQHYLIDPSKESLCFDGKNYRDSVLPEGDLKEAFKGHISGFQDKMALPTRLIGKGSHFLNDMTFYEYLASKLPLTDNFVKAIDYHMLDDYGGTSKQVSALTGMVYYGNRPFWAGGTKTFSPPEGNYYFVKKLAEKIPEESLLPNHLISKIEAREKHFEVSAIDVKNKAIKKILARKIVYAGQKHALKYVYPDEAAQFEGIDYAPWVVINFLVRSNLPLEAFWQNEFLAENNGNNWFLGFIDSDAQLKKGPYRVLTAYFCLPVTHKKTLRDDPTFINSLIRNTVTNICQYLDIAYDDFDAGLEKIFVKVMGHAMPVPKPGYLLRSVNGNTSNANIAYAGVDTFRLPLLFEALDSGLMAAKYLENRTNKPN